MSQQELAFKMGYKTRSTIAKIESGENDVSQKKLHKFAEILDTTVEALLTGYATVPRATVHHEISRDHRNVVIILAGGKTGLNSRNIPNQFIDIHGKPILIYSMEAYEAHPWIDDVYVVCLKGWEQIVRAYAKQYGISKFRDVIIGGKSGVESLKNGFDQIRHQYDDEDLIIIQEATRPMVNEETITRLLLACSESGSATISHTMDNYVQFDVSGGYPEYLERGSIVAMQSPEAHRVSILCEVFSQADKAGLPLTESCCTMLMYNLGLDINFIEGNINNVKIERDEDVLRFSALHKK
jgi:2-C-methyl-D-erythritol 4-phosphate cytidylyltransferase